MELKFVEPVAKNGKELALVNEEDVASEAKRWENAVVAYFLGHDSTFHPPSFSMFINNLIDSEWRKCGNVKVYSQGPGVFVLDFESARGKELALGRQGPRFYDGSKPFILKPWSRDMSLEIKELKSAPIWIKLPNLRLHLWSPEALSKISPLRMTKATDMIRRLSMNGSPHLDAPIVCTLCILILVQDTKRLSHARAVRNMDVSAVSEVVGLPGFCLGQHKALQILHLRQDSVQLLQCLVVKPQYLVQAFSSTPAFGSTPAATFGSTPAMSGGEAPVFGASFSSTPAFGSTPAPTFGSTPAMSTPAATFGSTPAMSTPAATFGSTPAMSGGEAPVCGASFSSTPLFGSAPAMSGGEAPVCGASFSSTPLFGSAPAMSGGEAPVCGASFSSTPLFGSAPAMSGGEAPVFGASFSSTPAFGSTPAPTFGSNLFSATAPGADRPYC
ncbi:hypothetical protein OIU77_002048 [Salix suchowensis]|uniref:DUF4283 domain-containing protein n=1 Tax=Salix suchowensis TaxID=1278906 RepID=A0ABQ9B5R3_9ROSI|nr:hypothetical protein OIU77_002048 [Salix suchowensis]